jgi:hypothetical protein
MAVGGLFWISSVNVSCYHGDWDVADDPATPASLGRILLLDFMMWICQLVSLELIYITAHSGNIPQSTMFPYPDYLLPPTYSHSAREAELTAIRDQKEEDVEDDVESGLKRRRKKGFESAFEELDGEMDALWLNDDDGPGGRPRGEYSSPLSDRLLISPATSTSRPMSDDPDVRIREPPLIFSLSFIHIFTLVFHLPLPNPPPAAFAGGTPNPTPPVTPGVETTSPQIQPRTLARVVETDIDSSRIQRELDQGEDERTRTMPGDFRNTGSRE